jgi:uncharacterized MAPEG superfamily protein
MTTPILVLMAFAGWTLLTLFGTVGFYRWSRILTGRQSIADWRADVPQGCEWYQRAMRAHMNCVENLPVYAAIVVALMATGLRSPIIDNLALVLLASRMAQTTVHITLPSSPAAASLRFALYAVQMTCMISMGVMTAIMAQR